MIGWNYKRIFNENEKYCEIVIPMSIIYCVFIIHYAMGFLIDFHNDILSRLIILTKIRNSIQHIYIDCTFYRNSEQKM